jgi:hypothetical protein
MQPDLSEKTTLPCFIMNIKSFMLPLFCLLFFSLVILLAPEPVNTRTSPLFVQNPILLRALSGPFHTLAADSYWLRSANINQPLKDTTTTQNKADSTLFESAQLIITLDPNFKMGLRYAATYLASIQHEVDQAHHLANIALTYSPHFNFPYEIKISNEMGYHHPYRYEKVVEWVKQARNETIDAPLWFNDLLIFARQNTDRAELVYQDLLWLQEMARTPAEKQMIQEKIEALDLK